MLRGTKEELVMIIVDDVSTFIMVFLIRKLRKPLLKFKALAMEIINQKALGSSATSPSGINTGTITTLPSGLVGKEENIDGKSLFSITEGMAKVFFPASTPEDVFYNPGIAYSSIFLG
jgi:hypothetical protein